MKGPDEIVGNSTSNSRERAGVFLYFLQETGNQPGNTGN